MYKRTNNDAIFMYVIFFLFTICLCWHSIFNFFSYSYSPDAHFISTNNNNTENRIIKIFKFIHVCLSLKRKIYLYTYSGKKISRKNWQIITTYDDANEVEAIVYVPFAMYDFYNFYFIAIRQTLYAYRHYICWSLVNILYLQHYKYIL